MYQQLLSNSPPSIQIVPAKKQLPRNNSQEVWNILNPTRANATFKLCFCANRNKKKVTSIMMTHCNYHGIYPEEGIGTSTDSRLPAATKPDFSPSPGRSVLSTTDPVSYDSGHIDDQSTPRKRSDTTGGTPYDLQPKRFHDDLCDVCPRRHSATASDRGYYRNKSNSSVGSAVSGTLSGSPSGSKVVAGRPRRSSDATNLLFSATLGFSNLLSAGSRDKLASQQCNDENVAEM